MKRYEIIITGIVQGVGFRPFIYNLAKQLDIKGWVGNIASKVVIEAEAEHNQIIDFIKTVKESAPALSTIESIYYKDLPLKGFQDFVIRQSLSSLKGPIYISPDVCTCEDCIKELSSKHDRRYMYPFINCTNCGPRFTIIKNIPYDRDKTTMEAFEMCSNCKNEYTNPLDRRYHAQPIACHDCGPSLGIADENGNDISNIYNTSHKCIEYICNILKQGKIAAIKGIGGYHLACNAIDEVAVDRLRRRKQRDEKPFALMVKNLDMASHYCKLNQKDIQLLSSTASPIVLLEKNGDIFLPDSIAHLNRYLGVMLPYTPIHHLLFQQEGFPEVLVMTSGNLSSEPIFYKDDEAISGLVGIADVFLTNNREIYIRTDDSVTRVIENKEYITRRSRGYVPKPIKLDLHRLLDMDSKIKIPSVLACGGELKNVFCLNRDNLFYLSHHIGDLENESTNNSFKAAVEHFKKLFDIKPELIAYDLHPGYFSSQYALEIESSSKTSVQHHKAHIASCMAENGLNGQVIGIAFDGTGYGEDGNIWGGEFFKGGYYGFERVGQLEYVMMPGGDWAVKQPWRMAVGYLHNAGLLHHIKSQINNVSKKDIDFILKMLERKINCPKTSSIGRLFDAVSALMGIKTDISYEGQAAIELEYYAVDEAAPPYEFEFGNNQSNFIVRTGKLINQIISDLLDKKSREHISSRFHSSIAEIILQGCNIIRDESGLNRVALSGGVFQNITLLKVACNRLKENGFIVYTHSQVPTNDGGISLGQAMIALANYISNS